MKKLVLLAAVAMSATMFSCGNAEKAEEAANDTVAAATEVVEAAVEEAVDTLAGDTVVEVAAEVAEAPVAE
ncbi:MAG: hypothetical protein K2M06_00040 [Muribaculaceae bacterium]|nr:hypothetical protein [Muribaculaceae bacterium]